MRRRAEFLLLQIAVLIFFMVPGELLAQCFNRNDAEFGGYVNMPAALAPGQTWDIEVWMGNRGSPGGTCPELWRPEYGYRLGTQNPPLNTTWGAQSQLVATSTTTEGQHMQVFKVRLVAPSTPGEYNLQFRMAQIGSYRNCFSCGGCETVPSDENPEWFGDRTQNVMIKVTSDPVLKYAALGDSYASGEGLGDWFPNWYDNDDHCSRSRKAYPQIVSFPGITLDRDSRFVACSGAEIENVMTKQQVWGSYTAPLQKDALPGTELVTMTIGGNSFKVPIVDSAGKFLAWKSERGFTRVLQDCMEADCGADTAQWNAYWEILMSEIRELHYPLSKLYRDIKQIVGGNKPVAVLGYPLMFPDAETEQKCGALAAWYTPKEQRRFREAAAALNRSIKIAARHNDFAFVDVQRAFEGHLICDGATESTRYAANEWINFAVIDPLRYKLSNASFHPTACGHAAQSAALQGTLLDPNAPVPAYAVPDCDNGELARIRDDVSNTVGIHKLAYHARGIKYFITRVPDWIGRAADVVSSESVQVQTASISPAEMMDQLASAEIPRATTTEQARLLPPSANSTVGNSKTDPDGKPDFVWRHKDGYNAIWGMDGTSVIESASLPFIGNANWKIVGAGDFSKDGQADLLWRNYETGEIAVWVMSRAKVTSEVFLPTVTDVKWEIGAVGDFDNDAHDDIVWHHADGRNSIWKMNGTSVVQQTSLPTTDSDTRWKIRGAGDFNGDGHTDIVWRHTHGQIVFWMMKGRSVQFQVTPDELDLTPNFDLSALADLNGDGYLDLVLRDIREGFGDIYVLYLKQTEQTGWNRIGRINLDWQIAGPR